MRRFREPSIIDFTKGREALGRAVKRRRLTLGKWSPETIVLSSFKVPAGLSPSEAAEQIVDVASQGAPRGSYFARRPDEKGRPRRRKS